MSSSTFPRRAARAALIAIVAFRLTCPRGKTWRTGTATGAVGLTVLDRTVAGKRSLLVMATYDARETALGQTAAGTLYALCR